MIKNYRNSIYLLIPSIVFSCSSPVVSKKDEVREPDFNLIVDGNICFSIGLDTAWLDKDYYCNVDESGHSVYCGLDSSSIQESVFRTFIGNWMVYDTNLNAYSVSVDELIAYKKVVPHWGSIEEWEANATSLREIASELSVNLKNGYLFGEIIPKGSFILATKNKLNLKRPNEIDDKPNAQLIIDWIAKHPSTSDFQKEYEKVRRGLWWQDTNSQITTQLFDAGSGIVFGYTNIVFDGQGYSDENPYLGANKVYVYTIERGIISGIEIESDSLFWKSLVCPILNLDNDKRYLLFENNLGSTYLYCDSGDNWSIETDYEVDYFDCPF